MVLEAGHVMEWKDNFVILVWNMEDALNGMEGRLPY